VGFRYTAEQIARGHDVRGYVRNLPDGGVQLVMEGEDQEMEAVVRRIAERMEGFIRNTAVTTDPATGEFEDFAVRH
jgi:acylphosphatase